MFGSNGPFSPTDYIPQYTNLDPVFHPMLPPFDSDSSAPPTPDIISGLMSLPDQLTDESYHSTSSPPSSSCAVDITTVKATRTKLIKEGLKLTIQSRRMIHGLDNVRPEYRAPTHEALTKEDEERRRRRRERNKVAATKCRNKKKERTGRLAEESESLEVNNNALKNEIHTLEAERHKLMSLLQGHHCAMRQPYYSHTNQVVTNGYTSWSSVSG